MVKENVAKIQDKGAWTACKRLSSGLEDFELSCRGQ